MTTPQDDMAKLTENDIAILLSGNATLNRGKIIATAIRSLTEERDRLRRENDLLKADFHDTTDIYEALGIAGNESPLDAIRALTAQVGELEVQLEQANSYLKQLSND